MARLAALGVSPSFHIHHIKYYGDALGQQHRGPGGSPANLAGAQRLCAGRAADAARRQPHVPPQGFALMQTAMNRTTGLGLKLNAEESITAQQALRAMTIHGAYQLRLQDKTGSLEVGKWADLQVVDRNPYTTPVHELDRIRTLAVYVGGKPQYRAP